MQSTSSRTPFANRLNEYFTIAFPCHGLRGANRVKSWCLGLKRTPRLALNVQDPVLFLPPQEFFHADDIARLIHALHMCVNLKELSVLPQCPRRSHQSKSIDMLVDLSFTLPRFVNSYFDETYSQFPTFLESQDKLETLEICWGRFDYSVSLPFLRTLACSPISCYRWPTVNFIERLRLDFKNSAYHDCEEHMLDYMSRCYSKSLAIFLKQNYTEGGLTS